MATLCNSFSPIFIKSSSSSVLFHEVKYIGNTNKQAVWVAKKQYQCNISVSTTSAPQFDHNENIFQDTFLNHYQEKLENIRGLLESKEEEEYPVESLIFVDTIQRLGVAAHYQKEIHTIMHQHHHYFNNNNNNKFGYKKQRLRDVALSFRLLRQRGYHVSQDVFKSFKGRDGKFRGDLKQDIWGLLELYEATHMSFEGEDVLDEAQDFCRQALLANKCKEEVVEMRLRLRLRNPFHKTIAKFTQKHFTFQRDDNVGVGGINTTSLTELSLLDSLWGKHVHSQELLQLSKWWNDLRLNKELKLARNQPVKWYTWSMAILIDDISLSEQRVELTKSIAFIYFIDDLFDLYGTLNDLAIFTEAVKKWEYGAMEMLPYYMKLCYKSLLDTTHQIGLTISLNHGHNPINSLKQTWASLCNAFLVEAKWLRSKNLPGAKEYLANAKVSSGVHVVLVHLFFLLGYSGTNLDDVSPLISCVATILRLWDDLGTAQDEHQNGSDGSYIECYMKDHPGSQFEHAREHAVDTIEGEWKRLNKECFNLKNHSSFREAALNLARMVPLMYSYDGNQRLPELEKYVQLMLNQLI